VSQTLPPARDELAEGLVEGAAPAQAVPLPFGLFRTYLDSPAEDGNAGLKLHTGFLTIAPKSQKRRIERLHPRERSGGESRRKVTRV
jgi:hypothetical protein